MAEQGNNLSTLFAELNKYGQKQEHERALKVCNKILQEAPKDEKAFHCKTVCLIQLGKFDECLAAIKKNNTLTGDLSFEKAYAEYRLNRTNEALATLRKQSTLDIRSKELLCQVLYRLEEYQECYDVYRDVVKNSQDDFEEERETNLSAVLASLQMWGHSNMGDPGIREETYELCYNSACLSLGMGHYQEAEAKLRKSLEMCRASLEEDQDTSEDEINEELGIIRVQLGYALQMQGKMDEAMKLYNQVVKQRSSDAGLTAVASNNIVTLNKDQNVFDSKKKMKAATGANLSRKLTLGQQKSIAVNQCLLYMYTNQSDMCQSSAKTLRSKYPSDDTPSLIMAADSVRGKQVNRAIESLQEHIKSNESEEGNINTKLTLAQLYLSQSQVYQACDVLKSMGPLTHKPGVVSTLVTLYLSQEDTQNASDVLKTAIEWYRANQSDSEELLILMRANANFQMKHGKPQIAAVMLEELRKFDPDDMKTLAQLIAAYSQFDPSKAQLISKDLPSAQELASKIDVDALESSFAALGPKYLKKQKTDTPQSPQIGNADQLIQKRKKKKKKGKMPKNYNPDVDPDPERWVPKRDRSYFKGRKKDKRKEIGRGPQGAVNVAADLDASKPSPTADAGSPRPSSTPTPNTGTTKPTKVPVAAKKSKSKKKGGKW